MNKHSRAAMTIIDDKIGSSRSKEIEREREKKESGREGKRERRGRVKTYA